VSALIVILAAIVPSGGATTPSLAAERIAGETIGQFRPSTNSVLSGTMAVTGEVACPQYDTQWGSLGSGDGQFNNAWGIATDPAGNVYVADINNNRIQKFSGTGTYLTQWGSAGSGNGQFNSPFGVATDAAGDVYVADANNNRIQKFSGTGTYLAQWGSLGTGNGQFNFPVAVATDDDGNVYVVDHVNSRIQKFSGTGTYLTQWGSLGTGDGQFEGPIAVATDAFGNVFVVDPIAGRIQKFTGAGGYLTQWGSTGSGNGQLNVPRGVATDPAGDVYVSDTQNRRIQKFSGTGTYLCQWGSFGSGDGQFSFPKGVATDAVGAVYVADIERVQRFASAPTFAITATSSAGGSIIPPGVTMLASGAAQDYSVTPDAGYGIFDVEVDGVSQGAISTYSFTNVTANHGIHASFTPTGPGATLEGVVNTALGAAELHVTADTVLVVSSIGTSGNDGVSFPASAPDEGRGIEFAGGGVPIDHAIDQGGSMVAEMSGTAGGEVSSLGTITLDVVADGIDITPDFSDLDATDVHVEAYLGSQRVHSCRVPNGSAMRRTAAEDGIKGVEVGLKEKPGGAMSAVQFASSKSVIVGGAQVMADRLEFSTHSLKQPVGAMSAALKMKRPPPLVTSGTGSVLAFSNLGQVAIRRQDPKPDVGGAPAGGIRMEPRGAAGFASGSLDDGATLVGIGASGEDGVDLVLDSGRGATHTFGDRMGFDTSTDAGAELEHRVRGKVGCRPDSTVAIVKESAYADSVTLRPDFSRIGATGVRITIRDEGEVVHQAAYPPTRGVSVVEPLTAGPRLLAASINTTRSNIKDKASIAASGVKVSWNYRKPPVGSGANAVTSHMGFEFMIGSNRYHGQEVEFEAMGAASVSELTGSSMKQKNPGGSKLDTLRMGRGELPLKGASADEMVASGMTKGKAHMTVKDDKMAIHNIGPSGEDGAKMKLEHPAERFDTRFSAKEGPGSASLKKLEVAASGKHSGAAEKAEVLRVKAEKTTGKYKIEPKGPGGLARAAALDRAMAASYRLEVLMGASVVATQDAAIPQAEFDNLPDRLRMVASGPAFEGYWDTPLLVSIIGGSSAMGDGIRILPLGEPDDVESIEEMDIEAAEFLSFELSSWEVPVVTAVDPALLPGFARLVLGRNPVLGAGVLKLSVSVPSAAWVDLDAFDAQGRRVASIFHGVQPAGTVTRTWSPGREAGSGVYFVRMKVGGVAQTEKAVFIR
jgi:hypothetical protein